MEMFTFWVYFNIDLNSTIESQAPNMTDLYNEVKQAVKTIQQVF